MRASRWVDWTHPARCAQRAPPHRSPPYSGIRWSQLLVDPPHPPPPPAPASSQKFAIHSPSSSLKPDSTGWKYGTAQSLRKILVKAINYHSRYCLGKRIRRNRCTRFPFSQCNMDLVLEL